MASLPVWWVVCLGQTIGHRHCTNYQRLCDELFIFRLPSIFDPCFMFIIQLTGLSGAGKTTLAHAVQAVLQKKGIPAEVIDADVYRSTINQDLGFSAADRRENIRRLAVVANQFRQQGLLAIIAAINPFEDVREELRREFAAKTVWIKCDLQILLQRDTKGLYGKALLPDSDPEKLRNLTGINHPYDIPVAPDLVIDTGSTDVVNATEKLLHFALQQMAALPSPANT